jgi:perosamine synthetase
MIKIPIYCPDLSGNEKKYINECIDSTWISSRGRFISEFEEKFSERINVSHSAGVSNGTVALHLALLSLGVGPGDEVIVPTLTYIASVNAITYVGATPVFADSLRSTWQINPDDVRRLISSKTKAIMVVHLYGQAADMDELLKIAHDNNLLIVEDCAEAFGTLYKGRHVGSFGDISTFSFFGNKTITTGEGGMVSSNDATLMERARHFRGQGLATYREYWHDVVGYNYRMTNIAAAIGLAQLERSQEFINRKSEIASKYKDGLNHLPVEFHDESPNTFHSYWMTSLLVENSLLREPLRDHLFSKGIETRPLFYPIHTMPMYSAGFRRHEVAEDLARRGINLPSWPGLKNEQVDEIIRSIYEFYGQK